MLTVEDLRKPRNVSGYKQVGLVRGPSRGTTRPYYQAYAGPGRRGDWKGPARQVAEQAAQDYCDFVNGAGVAAPVALNSAGHVGRKPTNDPEVAYALGVLRDARAQRAGKQGYVYCIGERDRGVGVKIGYSVNPTARVAELQTGNPRELVLLGAIEGTEADERDLHERYIGDNLIGEWFRPTAALLSEFDIEAEEVPAA